MFILLKLGCLLVGFEFFFDIFGVVLLKVVEMFFMMLDYKFIFEVYVFFFWYCDCLFDVCGVFVNIFEDLEYRMFECICEWIYGEILCLVI